MNYETFKTFNFLIGSGIICLILTYFNKDFAITVILCFGWILLLVELEYKKTNKCRFKMKRKCLMCGKEGLSLLEISKMKHKAFGRIPMKDVVKKWCEMGYSLDDVICEECILK